MREIYVVPYFLIKNSVFFAFLFAIGINNIHAQDKQPVVPDSLMHKTSDELIEHIKQSEIREAAIFELALLSKERRDVSRAEQYYEIAVHFYDNAQYQRCITYFNRAIEFADDSNNDKLLPVVYLKQGNAYRQLGENELALDSYYNFLELSQEMNNIDYEFIATTNIAMIHRNMGQTNKALEKCKKALDLINKTSFKNKSNHVNILTVTAETYLDLTAYDSVLHYAEMGLKISDSIDYKLGLADLWIKTGIVHYKKEDCEQAFPYFLKAEDILLKNDLSNSFHQKIYANYFIASCFYRNSEYNPAISYLQNTINLLKKEDIKKNYVLNTYLLLAKTYHEIDDAENSIYWYDEYTRLNEESKNDKKRTISKIYEKETQEFKEEISQLKKERQKSKTTTQYVIATLSLISLILLFLVFKYVQKRKSNKILFTNLIEKITKLESQEGAQITTLEESRKEITIDDDKVTKILNGLDKLVEKEYFLKSDCNLRSMAKKLKTNATYLSKIINIHKEKNFTDYLNDLRIDYVLKRLKADRKFRSFSVKSIATEIGYKSDYSFAKHFKSRTNLNPSYYIKEINRLQQNK